MRDHFGGRGRGNGACFDSGCGCGTSCREEVRREEICIADVDVGGSFDFGVRERWISNGIDSDVSADYGIRRGSDRDTRSGGKKPSGMVAIRFTAVARCATRTPECGANPSTTCRSTWVVRIVAVAALSCVATVYATNGDSHVDDGLDGDA